MSERILVADDDAEIVRFVELNLQLEGFEVLTAPDGERALALATEHLPDLVILDVMMPKLNGYEVCQRLREQPRTAQISIIILTAKTLSADKVVGLTAGADDYIGKPFDPVELVARVRTTLRRSREMRAVSPLTGLPGNLQIDGEMRRRGSFGEAFGVLWLDLDNFKAYNDRYGFTAGDRALLELAGVLREQAEPYAGTFVGHIGGDDFVVMCKAEDAEPLADAIVRAFDECVPGLYDESDRARGGIEVRDRRGDEKRYPLLSISIGGATTADRAQVDHRELVQLATQMKGYAKAHAGSFAAIDRRRDASGPPS